MQKFQSLDNTGMDKTVFSVACPDDESDENCSVSQIPAD